MIAVAEKSKGVRRFMFTSFKNDSGAMSVNIFLIVGMAWTGSEDADSSLHLARNKSAELQPITTLGGKILTINGNVVYPKNGGCYCTSACAADPKFKVGQLEKCSLTNALAANRGELNRCDIKLKNLLQS